jgi:hypothetical protein
VPNLCLPGPPPFQNRIGFKDLLLLPGYLVCPRLLSALLAPLQDVAVEAANYGIIQSCGHRSAGIRMPFALFPSRNPCHTAALIILLAARPKILNRFRGH